MTDNHLQNQKLVPYRNLKQNLGTTVFALLSTATRCASVPCPASAVFTTRCAPTSPRHRHSPLALLLSPYRTTCARPLTLSTYPDLVSVFHIRSVYPIRRHFNHHVLLMPKIRRPVQPSERRSVHQQQILRRVPQLCRRCDSQRRNLWYER